MRYLESRGRGVEIADEAQPVDANRHRGVLADITYGVDGATRRHRTRDVRAMRDPQVAVREVAIADKGEAVGADCDGVPLRGNRVVDRGECRRGARGIRAMSDLEGPTPHVHVADYAKSVGADPDGGIRPHGPGGIKGREGRGRTLDVRAVRDLEV